MAVEALRGKVWLRRLADYWALTKAKQTGLLLLTGIAGYITGVGRDADAATLALMIVGLFLSLAGCTALNMVLDREVDARMSRTAGRPLPQGRLRPLEAALFGGALSAAGLLLCFRVQPAFGAVVTSGFLFDLFVYTLWLKRRTALSILLGGVAGGMPILAGRTLALGHVDGLGLLLAGAVLLWIPAHILTLATHYAEDYRRAGIPVWPNQYGARSSRLAVASATALNAVFLAAAAWLAHVHLATLGLQLAAGATMLLLAVQQLFRPSERGNWRLFKAASVYMVASSLLLTVGKL
ncbi:MAG: heme o synthase [Chloroflexia bacterium]